MSDLGVGATVPSVSPRRRSGGRQVLIAVAMIAVAAVIVGGGLWLAQARHDAVEHDVAWCTDNGSSDDTRGPESGRLCLELVAP